MILLTLLITGGLWFGHAAWHAHRQLVTLDVRDVPLADVLRKIESQTWTRIRAETSVDARITLHVKDSPLGLVLDRIAEQAGARWSTVYAVYDSSRALKALDSALRGDGKLEPVGWTRVAPNSPRLGQLREDHGPSSPLRSDSSPDSTRSMWSPKELVAVTSLSARIRSNGPTRELVAAGDSAAQAARAANGKWTTYLAFRKSIGFGGEPPGPKGLGQGGPSLNPMEAFANLTPEQRVQQARQH